MSDLKLTLRLNADGSVLQGEMRKASGEVAKFSSNLEGGAKRGTAALRGTERQTRRLSSTTRTASRRVAGLAAGYLSLRAGLGVLREITQNTLEQERLWRQLTASIETTEGAAGRSLMQLQGMSSQLQDTTTYSNEAVESVMAQLLAFRNISNQVFDRTLSLVLDFAELTGRDASQAVRTLALAINDPLQGMGRLSQAGISLSASLRETVKSLVESGDLVAAQNLLLDELDKSFGGAAAAARATFGGALKALRNDFDDLLKYTGEMPALTAEIEAISQRLHDPGLRERMDEGIAAALGLIPPAVNAGVTAIEKLVPLLAAVVRHADLIAAATKVLATVITTRLVMALGAAAKAKVLNIALSAQLATGWRRSAAAATTLAVATKGASGAFALIGGPIGAVTLAATGLVLGLLDVRRELNALKKPSAEATEALKALREIAAEGWEADRMDEVRKKLTKLRAELLEVSRARAAAEGRMERSGGGYLGEFLRWLQEDGTEALRQNEERLQENIRLAEHLAGIRHYDDLANGLELVSTAGEVAVDLMERIGLVSRNAAGGIGEMAAANAELIDPLTAQVQKLQEQLIEMTAGEEALLSYQQAQALTDAAREDAANGTTRNTEAVIRHFDALRTLQGQIADERAAQEKATQAALADEKARQAQAQKVQGLVGSYRQLLAAANPLAAQQAQLNEQLAGMQTLAGLGAKELADLGVSSEQIAAIIEYLRGELDSLGESEGLSSLSEEVQSILDWVDQLDMDPLVRDIQTLEDALADATDPEVVERLQDAISRLRQELGGAGLDVGAMMAAYAEGTSQALSSIQQLTQVGSKEYQAIEVAIAAANLQAAIAAILNQGMGDPYTAPLRMAAMASAVAGLVGSIQGFGAGMDTTAQDRQQRQGTGSVLGDSEAKSESILNATQITADAVSELVGINRNMARNLQRLADGIAGASGMLARGAGDSEFAFDTNFAKYENAHKWGAMGEIWKGVEFALDPLGLFGGVFDWVGKLFGGSSKVVDEGIAILGGTIGELIDQTLVQAFQEVKYKKWVFGSSKRETAFADLDDDLARQFQLIFESIANSVAAGAEALGLSAEEIEAAIAQYEVAAQQISLKDLTAEEQQAELEAVFSKIFDGLAGQVVPFLPQFQKVGEGLAETLIRVATGVQVNEEAMRRFGWAVDQTDPERFAQISQGLIDLVGGLDLYISGINSFFDAFAPSAVKMEIAQSDLTRALEQVGLAVPGTREEMWALMTTLDASTEAGREQIAMLLELTDAADTYYSHLEAVESERLGLERQILELHGNTAALRALELESLDESNRALQERIWALEEEIAREQEIADIMSTARDDIASLSLDPLVDKWQKLEAAHVALMQRADELGISEQNLAVLRYRHQLQIRQLTAELEESVRSLWEQLQGGDQFGSASSFGSGFTSSIDNAADQVRDSIIRALEGVEDWLNRSTFEDPSLTPRAQLQAMQAEFDRLVNVALTGSGQEQADAIGALPQLADQLEALGVRVHGSATEPFQDFRTGIVEAMQQVMGIDVPAAQDPVTGTQVGYIGSGVDSIGQGQRDQTAIAARIVEQIGALVEISGAQAPDIADRLGVNLGTVIEALVGEVQEGSTATVEQLVAVANSLGMELTEVADAIGLHVGALTDQESLFSQALEAAVLRMPAEIQEQLWGPLDRVWQATSEADANDAIADLINATKQLPVDYQNALAPFFDEIDTVDLALAQIGLLDQIRAIGDESAAHLAMIARALAGDPIEKVPPVNPPIPGDPTLPPPKFATGGWASGIIQTGDGGGPELVLPHDVSAFFARAGVPVNAGRGDPRVVERLEQLIQIERRALEQREEIGQRQHEATVAVSTSMEDAAREARSAAGIDR